MPSNLEPLNTTKFPSGLHINSEKYMINPTCIDIDVIKVTLSKISKQGNNTINEEKDLHHKQDIDFIYKFWQMFPPTPQRRYYYITLAYCSSF